jgi:hypothetical protein
MNTRSFASSSEPAEPVAQRSTLPPAAAVSSEYKGVSGSAQFTMSTPYRTYVGGEIESGVLEASGSKLGGAYAVVGAETSLHVGSLAVEVAGGWRALQYEAGVDGVDSFILEPRLRGNVWMSEQFTFGAAIGATLGERDAFMAGVYFGVYSHPFNAR